MLSLSRCNDIPPRNILFARPDSITGRDLSAYSLTNSFKVNALVTRGIGARVGPSPFDDDDDTDTDACLELTLDDETVLRASHAASCRFACSRASRMLQLSGSNALC